LKEGEMEKTWMPLVAGILDIICGAVAAIITLGFIIAGSVTGVVASIAPDLPPFVPPMLLGFALPVAAMAVVAILGGVRAIKVRSWGLALAGSIVAFFVPWCWILGLAAIVLTALSRKQFA